MPTWREKVRKESEERNGEDYANHNPQEEKPVEDYPEENAAEQAVEDFNPVEAKNKIEQDLSLEMEEEKERTRFE